MGSWPWEGQLYGKRILWHGRGNPDTGLSRSLGSGLESGNR